MSKAKNAELKDHSTADKINVTQQSIDLPVPNLQSKKKDNNSFFQDQSIESLRIEIFHLKKENKYLKKELQSFSVRLDEALKKHLNSAKKQNISSPSQVSHMELQNAYKKCQIYKRQINFYKKKMESFDEGRMEEIEAKAHQFMKENQELRNELKNIRKISKLQERGLEEVGAQGYVKVNADNEKLKEEVRRLKKQMSEYVRNEGHRSVKTSGVVESNQVQSSNKLFAKPIRNLNNQNNLNQPSQPANVFQKKRLRTEHQIPAKEQDELVNFLQQKSEKDDQKIRTLLSDKAKLREMLDNAKGQIAEQEKQNNYLKEKISTLRKNNALLLQKNHQKGDQDRSLERKVSKQRIKSNKQDYQQGVDKSQKPQKNEMAELKDAHGKYPRVEDSGVKKDHCLKWNHHQFSSKIKQIQILPSEDGHIMDIHVRYQKGEPKKYDKSSGNRKYSSFICSQANEYIKEIQGGFQDGFLQYLILTTNTKRVSKFCKIELQNNKECAHFSFNITDNEYPAALFGESDNEGITRLGCFIQKE